MTATLSVVSDVAGVELDGFRLGYVAADGTRHGVSLAGAWVVRFEAMSPARRYGARKGQRPQRWRAVNAPHLVALVRARAVFAGGQLVERPPQAA